MSIAVAVISTAVADAVVTSTRMSIWSAVVISIITQTTYALAVATNTMRKEEKPRLQG